MGPLSLRIALPLAWVCAAAALALLIWPGRAVADEAVMALVLLVLAAAGAALLPLLKRLARRAGEADALAARLAEQEAQLARALRQRHEALERLSHDLRTPLASMQGYLELLLLRHGTLEAAEAQNYLQTAVRNGERLSRLVGDLLELARLEADAAPLHSEPFPVAELAHDVAQRFAAAAERAQVALVVRAEQQPTPIVQAEVRLVERVLGNLVENALRHTPCGGRVAIEVEGAEADGRGARISVSDTGEGIAAADLEGIFDRYETAARVGEGGGAAGLGLAIARRIAALHGSPLELRSRPGAGTTVTFTLPGAAGAADAVDTQKTT
ncbi:MAG: HAMP domain-containing histidine kinase [Burkholderiales bacterium]|nr:HAMP domain-containing histidine kinase [Burkholderiales bacterium]